MTIRHVFVFRHCVRSTDADVKVLDADPSAYSTDPADYVAVPLPDWQTSPMWCTKVGSDILLGTGKYLVESYFPQFGPSQTMRVHFVTDIAQRDVDTSLDMAQGMATAMRENSSIKVQGLNQLEYDADLFKPTEPKWDTNQSLCSEAPRIPRNNYVAERLGTISKPSTVDQVVHMIGRYGGVGTAGPISNLPSVFVNQTVSKLGGRIAPIKYIAESAFYAAASEIPFFENITKPDLFDLVSWVHWERAVASVGNNHAAVLGGVMMDRVLRTLQSGVDDETHNDQVAHFFVGHDGDLNHLATALGITWVLPDPYRSGRDGILSPTPPSTGLHFSYDTNGDGSLGISILTPMYFNNDDSEELIVNKTGVLEERPVNFTQQDVPTRIVNGRTIVTPAAPHNNVLEDVRSRLEQLLQNYEGAMECYLKVQATASPPPAAPAAMVASPTMQPSPVAEGATHSPTKTAYNGPTIPEMRTDMPTITHAKPESAAGHALVGWLVFILMATALFVVIRNVRRGGRQSATYTEMGDARNHELNLEMT